MNYYDELCVDKNASEQEIKKAYRLLAKKYHPDRNSSFEAIDKIKNINAAYEILGDPIKRKEYDRKSNSTFQGFGVGNNFNMNDIFSNFQGFDIQKHKPKTNIKKTFKADEEISIDIEFIESIKGSLNKTISILYKYECSKCNGHGGIFDTCNKCSGTGLVSQTDDFINIKISCNECYGSGKKRTHDCIVCNNQGYIEKKEDIQIKIPEGLQSRTKLFVKGKGNYINGFRGDLYIMPNIMNHDLYQRKGNNIIMQYNINVLDMMLEKKVSIDTINGNVEFLLYPDMQRTITIIGKGTKTINSDSYGDLIIDLNILIPTLTDNQKEFIKKIK